ncbi:MAG: Polysaccharide biosynthesis protein [Microgenomates group bacterium GW2011_GWA2_44_7]|nr:MAG: Polysaccharide biosynthesis protein [Microgenomates group bacterium GW2011_GWA2_44_7]
MKSTVEKILKQTLWTSTGRSSIVTFISMVASTGFAALYFIVLARMLGPYGNGLFSVALAVMMTITGVVDFGTNFGIVNFVPKAVSEGNQRKALAYLKLGLVSKLVLGLAATFIIALTTSQISSVVLKRPEITPILFISSFGIIAGLLYGYGLSVPQALQKFAIWGGLLTGAGFFRIITVLILIIFGWLSAQTAMLAYLIMLLFPFFGSLPFLPKGILKAKIQPVDIRKFFSFNRWMALFTLTVSITANMDRFFLARFSGLSEVGLYMAATQIAGVGLNVNAALATVLVPKFAAIRNRDALIRFLKKSILLTSGLAIGGALITLFAGILMESLFGQQYIPAISTLRILILSVACVLAFLPFTCVWLYYRGDSRSFALYYILNGVILFLGNLTTVAPREKSEIIEPVITDSGR